MDWKWIQLAGGAVLGLSGWTLYWLGLRATGVALGMTLGAGAGVLAAIIMNAQNDGVWTSVVIGAAVGGGAGVFLSRTAHKILFFTLGAVSGALGVHAALAAARRAGAGELAFWTETGLGLAASVGGGVLAVIFSKYIISAVTAVLGAVLVLTALDFRHSEVAIVPLSVVFFVVQTRFLRHVPDHFDQEPDSS
ncbi:MAG: hypothetical protein Kow0059_09900 [Candidatus Sumerlaeia bacterium]